MNLVLRCTDGVVLQVISCQGTSYRLEQQPVGRVGNLIALTSAQVRACFEERPLRRAHAVASLTPAAFDILCGPSPFARRGRGKREGPIRTDLRYYKTQSRLQRIGKRITDPYVCKMLANETLATLDEAQKGETPGEQINRAFAVTANKLLEKDAKAYRAKKAALAKTVTPSASKPKRREAR